jgi:cytochrome P450
MQTATALATCIFGLLENPDALVQARQQIQEVVGSNRLPSFADISSLPYITAIAKECLRWRHFLPVGMLRLPKRQHQLTNHPVTLGVPHMLESYSDDVYRGYRIPARSVVIANAWY